MWEADTVATDNAFTLPEKVTLDANGNLDVRSIPTRLKTKTVLTRLFASIAMLAVRNVPAFATEFPTNFPDPDAYLDS